MYVLKHQDFGYFRHIADDGTLVFTTKELAMRFPNRTTADAIRWAMRPELQMCDVEEADD